MLQLAQDLDLWKVGPTGRVAIPKNILRQRKKKKLRQEKEKYKAHPEAHSLAPQQSPWPSCPYSCLRKY